MVTVVSIAASYVVLHLVQQLIITVKSKSCTYQRELYIAVLQQVALIQLVVILLCTSFRATKPKEPNRFSRYKGPELNGQQLSTPFSASEHFTKACFEIECFVASSFGLKTGDG